MQQESIVKESLFRFIMNNIPTANLTQIDDIVLSYVISILEESSQDSVFDVDGKNFPESLPRSAVYLYRLYFMKNIKNLRN